jgi:hypothetical protein
MYKTSQGSKKFSFSRFTNNAVPNLAAAPRNDDLTLAEQDQLFEYQLGLPNPAQLSELSYFAGSITSPKPVSGQIHTTILKKNVLSATSPAVKTNAIASKFAHQLPIISSFGQRKLVNLLLFWEEEQQRWRVLEDEEKDIETVLEAERSTGGAVGTLETRLKELEGLIKLKPSIRNEMARDAEVLPAYEDVQAQT